MYAIVYESSVVKFRVIQEKNKRFYPQTLEQGKWCPFYKSPSYRNRIYEKTLLRAKEYEQCIR